MTKQYLMKFKDSVDDLKKDSILNTNQVIKHLDTFGIYIVALSDDIMSSLTKDDDVLYVKENKKVIAS